MESAVLIQVTENPNCSAVEGLVFQPRSAPRPISKIRTIHCDAETWCEITGLDENGRPCAALACLIDDSGDGACYLLFGGGWGLRFKAGPAPWNLDDPEQWGEGYLLIPGDESSLHFAV